MPRSDKYSFKCSSYYVRVLLFHFTFKSLWNHVRPGFPECLSVSDSLTLAVCPSSSLCESAGASSQLALLASLPDVSSLSAVWTGFLPPYPLSFPSSIHNPQ